jgi:virginiamycin B lyase
MLVLAVVVCMRAIAGQSIDQWQVDIREWDVPGGAPAFPHDPTIGGDGLPWYTGYRSNVLGRLNPGTGAITEFPLPIPNSLPHGLVADADGNIWYTASGSAMIGKLDPKSGHVTEYPMPDRAAADPHTPVFDQKGILWFTVQNSNFVGRLDPATKVITLRRVSIPNAMPHGIVVNSRGVPLFAMAGTNRIGSIDPQTMDITDYTLPDGARARRLAVSADDLIWYGDYARGFLGQLNATAGKVTEFPSPGGVKSAPYSIAVTPAGNIWYTESGVSPNTVVLFDRKSKAMRSWPIHPAVVSVDTWSQPSMGRCG